MARLLFLQNHEAEYLGPMHISAERKRAGHECRPAVGSVLADFAPAVEAFQPRVLPLIRKLIRCRPNMLFSLWFGFVYFLLYLKSERRSFWKTLRFALANARHVLK